MCDSNDEGFLLNDSEDDPKRESAHEEETVARVTLWKPLGISRDFRQGAIEFGIKVLGGINIAFGIPAQGLRIVHCGGRANDDVSHRVQPFGALVHELRTTTS